MLHTFGAGIGQSILWLATDWTTDGIRGYIPDRGKRFSSSPELPDRLRGPLSLQWLPVSDIKGVKRPWSWQLTSSARYDWSYTSFPHMASWLARDQFTRLCFAWSSKIPAEQLALIHFLYSFEFRRIWAYWLTLRPESYCYHRLQLPTTVAFATVNAQVVHKSLSVSDSRSERPWNRPQHQIFSDQLRADTLHTDAEQEVACT